MLKRIVLLVSALALLLGMAPEAKSYSADRFDVNLALQPDGSVGVTETIDFRFVGGPFTYVYDLKPVAMMALQTAPQIRLVQNSDQALLEKIQTSIMTTIPLWKNQVIIAIALFDQKKGLELQRAVTNTTNELLLKNAEMLQPPASHGFQFPPILNGHL